MPLLQVILILAVVGFALWLVTTYIPMAAPFPAIITVVVVLVVCIWLLGVFGVNLNSFNVGTRSR